MTTAIECPSCGSPDHWQSSSDSRKRMCESCGKVYYADQLETVKDMQKEEVRPPVSPTTKEQPTEDISSNGCSIAIIILAILAVCGIFFLIYRDFRRLPKISTIGQYEVWPVDCDTGTVVVKYGFDGEGPLLTVYPERKGEDIWLISPQIEEEIKMRAAEPDYLWVHCDNAEKEPEYFLNYFPLPVDGMKVVFKD